LTLMPPDAAQREEALLRVRDTIVTT
jgi:hypothetical protein